MYEPACGDPEPHYFHNYVDDQFKSRWCGGLCECRCTCVDHQGLPHGPGDHK